MNEKQFWDWFSSNKTKLEEFLVSDMSDCSLYTELTGILITYHENLVPEMTMDADNNHILILSCDGRREGIEYVERLYDAAPVLDRWIVQKYRSPGHVTELSYQELEFPSGDIKVRYSVRGNLYDIELFIKGYSENDERYMGLGFLYLDHLVGEYNVMTSIGTIDFKKPPFFSSGSDKVSLQQLRAIIERLN